MVGAERDWPCRYVATKRVTLAWQSAAEPGARVISRSARSQYFRIFVPLIIVATATRENSRRVQVSRVLAAIDKRLKAAKKKRKGRSEPTARLIFETIAYARSLWTFQTLIKQGLRKNDVLVDYGCGQMRIGIHAIRYLGPEAYWGFDIAESQLEAGRQRLGSKLLSGKKPHLCIISSRTIKDCIAAGPNFVCSIDVMNRVPAEDLQEYLRNITLLTGSSGKAIIRCRWSNATTFQFGQNWAYPLQKLRNIVSHEAARLDVVRSTPWEFIPGATGAVGLLQISPR
jgi:hypothetical protein